MSSPLIPVTVLTGFLGAGKTTLLNRLLKSPEAADTAVVVNEFGEVGIDHLLVERADDGVVLLGAGCLCCTIRGELIETLGDLAMRRDAGAVPPFRRVIVETTGLADPAPILQTIMAHPAIQARYRLGAVVTVADALNGEVTLAAHHESVKQIAVADVIVLSKSDLLDDPARASRLMARLHSLNPGAVILDAMGEDIVARVLEAGLFDPASKPSNVQAWLAVPDHGHHGHAHDPNRHSSRIRAFTLTVDKPMAVSALDGFLELLRAQHGPNLLRMKALVMLADDPSRPLVLHAVQHVLHAPIRLDSWPDADRRSRLVFIMQDTDPDVIEALFAAFRGEPRIDAPDASALVDNPLALN